VITEKCSFCGRHKKVKGDVIGPKVVLIVNEENGKAICQHCLAKSVALLNDPTYAKERIINITDHLGPSLPPAVA
jgi:hypothetical protein